MRVHLAQIIAFVLCGITPSLWAQPASDYDFDFATISSPGNAAFNVGPDPTGGGHVVGRGSVGAKSQRRSGEGQDCDAVEKGDAHDRGMDSGAIADGQRGQREHAAVSMATRQTQEVAIHKN